MSASPRPSLPDAALDGEIRARLGCEDERITDLHLWRVGPGHIAAIVSLVSDRPEAPAAYKARLADLPGLSHVTIEVNPRPEHSPARPVPAPTGPDPGVRPGGSARARRG